MSRAYPRVPVAKWPDDEAAAATECRGCGLSYRVVAVNPSDPSDPAARCGRDRCPHCGESRQIPESLHPVYTQWFGLVAQATRRAVRCGLPEDVAEDVAHRAYAEAVLRWVPAQAAFNTFATVHIHSRLGVAIDRWKRAPVAGCGLPRDVAAPEVDVEAADDREHAAVVAEAFLAVLSEREARVIRGRFGIGRDPATQGEIGRELGLSGERVRQIELAAMKKLRDAEHSDEG